MEQTHIVVLNENTFGYTCDNLDKPFIRIFILAVQTLRGGDPLLLDNVVLATTANTRLAVDSDFDSFRVSIRGYKNNPAYHWDRAN